MQILDVEAGKTAAHFTERASAPIRKMIFQCRHRQTRIVRVPRLERTPANDFGGYRQSIISESNGAKRKACFERSLLKTRQTVSCAGGPIPRSGRPKQFSRWHRSLQHARSPAFPFDRDGSENCRFIENFRMIPERDMGKRPGPFQAKHPRSNPTQGKCNMIHVRARVLTII